MKINRKSALVTAAVVVFGFGALACGGAGNDSDSGKSPKVSGSAASASPDQSSGPVTAKVGQTVTITDGLSGEDEIAFTVKSVKQVKSDNQFAQPEKGKVFIGVQITTRINKGDALMTGDEIKLIGPDGEVYNNEMFVAGIDGLFEWTNLKAGQQKSGLVIFQAPSSAAGKGAKIEVNSFWGDSPSAYFTV
jgi:hypothetical protein